MIVTDIAIFTPSVFPYIHVDLNALKKLPYWRRQLVAIYIHEFIHLLQFVFVYRCNTKRWEHNVGPELFPILAQTFFFWLTVPDFRSVPFQVHFVSIWNDECTSRAANPPSDFKKGLRKNDRKDS